MTTKSLAGLMLSAALVISPVAASAAPASPEGQGQVTAQGDASGKASVGAAEKKICKQLPSSSSRMTKRACHTKEEWKQVEKEAQGY